jgi:hypothetical protein
MAGVLGLLTLVGCAHGTMRGSVAMKASDEEAHVCLGNNEVQAGDKVSFFKNVCIRKGKYDGGECQREKLGEGEIIRTLNHHYSVAKVNPGVAFDEGTVVEKN